MGVVWSGDNESDLIDRIVDFIRKILGGSHS